MPLPENYDYKPLPELVELRKSDIHGYGIFSVVKLYHGDIIGMSHIVPNLFHKRIFNNGLIRTPLGGYINHSDDANCFVTELANGYNGYYFLVLNKTVEKDTELTLDYNNELCGLIT